VKVLVTGGAGFVGSHVVDALAADGDEVVVLDRRSPHHHERRAGVRYMVADARDPESWEIALGGVDAVCHQAARVGLGVDLGDVVDYVADNGAASAAGIWAMHRCGFSGRVVLASSMVVYGEGAYTCATCGPVRPRARRQSDLDAGRWEPPCPRCGSPLDPAAIDEDAVTDPRNVYAATKLHQEHLFEVFGRESGATVVALRYHNVYGPRMPRDTPYAGVAAIFASAIAAGRPIAVFEDGRQRRDFVHVTDVAAANLAALRAPAEAAGTYNVASGRAVTVAELAHGLVAVAGADVGVQVVGGYRLGDVRHVVASPARAADALGFRATVDLAEGLAELHAAAARAP